MYGLLLHTAIASQVQLEIIIKILVETFQGDIFRFLFIPYKLMQMFVGTGIAFVTPFLPVHTDSFLELLVMFPEQCQQGQFLLTDTQHGILDQFRRNETKAVFDTLVMPPDLFVQVVYGTIYGKGVFASAVGTSRFRIPQGGIYRYLNADLFPIGIDTYLAQQLTRSILAYLCTVDIEQDCKRAAVLYLFIPNVIIYVHG